MPSKKKKFKEYTCKNIRGWYDAVFRLGHEICEILKVNLKRIRRALRSKSRSRRHDVSSLNPNRRTWFPSARSRITTNTMKDCQILVEKLEKNKNDDKSEKYNVISLFTYTP